MVRNLINKYMTKEIQSITDPVSINKKIVENSVEIYNIIKNTNCEFEEQVLEDCKYWIAKGMTQELNFTDMIDSEEILNDLRGRYA